MAQPPHDQRDVRPEDPAIGVNLVDHDIAQPAEEPSPLRVIRQDPLVQHVGVREDEVPLLPELPPGRDAGVAVVHAGPHVRPQRAGARVEQPPERLELVLRQRLGRKEIQRVRARISGQGLDHRQRVGERLAARGAGDEHDRLARAHVVDRLRLVRVEPLDSECVQRRAQRAGQRRRRVGVARRPGREPLDVNDLAAVVARTQVASSQPRSPGAARVAPGARAAGTGSSSTRRARAGRWRPLRRRGPRPHAEQRKVGLVDHGSYSMTICAGRMSSTTQRPLTLLSETSMPPVPPSCSAAWGRSRACRERRATGRGRARGPAPSPVRSPRAS